MLLGVRTWTRDLKDRDRDRDSGWTPFFFLKISEFGFQDTNSSFLGVGLIKLIEG
jgi:hypothetical protein